jgi:hypothetical protein
MVDISDSDYDSRGLVQLSHSNWQFDLESIRYERSTFRLALCPLDHLVSQTSRKKESRVSQTAHNPESLTRRFS